MAEACVEQGERQRDGRQDTDQGRDDAEPDVLSEEVEADGKAALKDNENQADVAEGEEGFLPFQSEYVGDWDAVDQADDDLSNQSGAEDLVGQPFGDGKKDEEGDQSQYADDVGLMILEECAAWVGGHGGKGVDWDGVDTPA